MYLRVVSPPAAEPIALTDALSFVKQPPNSSDSVLVKTLIQAARERVEGFLARSLVNKGYVQAIDSFPYFVDTIMSQRAYPPSYYSLPQYSTTLWNYSQMIKLLRSPLVQVSKIVYVDAQSGNNLTLLPALPNWQALTEYTLGFEIEDSNGNLQVVTAVTEGDEDSTSLSGQNTPAWSVVLNGTTTDGMLTWTCMGPVPTPGFVFDSVGCPPRLFPMPGSFWPPVLYVPNAVQIFFTAGYGADGAAVPAGIKVAALQLIAHWYFNREPVAAGSAAEIPQHVESLLWNERVVDLAPTAG